ncbi:Protein of unknown function [Peptoclostridium litorale DSM 5388]|uniref:Uncharacterized protein n=1 Tax=Peptoclostridium litorale DSM 5388 TaxID=1121324 RepID=A0A069RE80_PEPLI|nr:DUF3006 domain-containing protein [Peptoclostridium litorale]KDR95048.1 hypothetical protein CLIT_11c00770 [Peptoclostridium litorale DSM 5388]SIN75886.1 Protein of unknown function [Peptoclostridium litorale DSM 5388]
MKKGIIDRFEGDIAVVEFEDKTHEDIPNEKLPPGVQEGDVLIIEKDSIKLDKKETKRLRDEIESLMDELFK